MQNELVDKLKLIDLKKAQLDTHRPFRELELRRLNEAMDVEYAFHSNAIEGNRLTLMETMLVIVERVIVPSKSLKEHLEAVNHQSALEMVRELASKISVIDQHDIKSLHGLILGGINNRYAGKFRDLGVYISGANHKPPQATAVPDLMNEFSYWLVERQDEQDLHPVFLAAQAHLRLVGIHPFIDGNGRSSRLLMNLILMKYGFPYAVIQSQMEQRRRYYQALDKAHVMGVTEDFELLVAERVTAMLDVYLGALG